MQKASDVGLELDILRITHDAQREENESLKQLLEASRHELKSRQDEIDSGDEVVPPKRDSKHTRKWLKAVAKKVETRRERIKIMEAENDALQQRLDAAYKKNVDLQRAVRHVPVKSEASPALPPVIPPAAEPMTSPDFIKVEELASSEVGYSVDALEAANEFLQRETEERRGALLSRSVEPEPSKHQAAIQAIREQKAELQQTLAGLRAASSEEKGSNASV